MSFLESLEQKYLRRLKSFAVLLDPDKLDDRSCQDIIERAVAHKVDYFLIGGSLITNDFLSQAIASIKSSCSTPVVIFPGNSMHIDASADALLFLSLISGRNAEFLIGQHVVAAPHLKKSGLEVVPTGYILVDCGRPTTVSYMSNTTPLPYDKPTIAACTAMAGEMLGHRLIYLDGGSGASTPVSNEMISIVRRSVDVPLIVGGGIDTADKVHAVLDAGADMVVVGNAVEKDPGFVGEVSKAIAELNKQAIFS